MIESVEGAKRLRLIILDACRDNPFGKRIKRMIAVRGISPGLAKIEPPTTDTLIAYAAKAGSTAEDGSGVHSPFTTALLDNLVTPGLDIRIAFGRVRDEVMKMTHNRQEPFVYGSLGGKLVALVSDRKQAAPAPVLSNVADPVVRDFEFARDIGTKEAWESFMTAHPGAGYYYNLAKAARDKLGAAGSAQPAKPAPPAAIAMAPANDAAAKPEPSAIDRTDLAKLLQVHLKQVGCDPGELDGAWNEKTSHAMALFNKNAHTNFDVKVASLDALEAVKAHQDRVCPLECGKGQHADGDRCVADACKRGYIHNKDGECVRQAKTAERPAKRNEGGNDNGHILCDKYGCKKMPKNCTETGYGVNARVSCN